IKHWKIHNYIRNDRYKPTLYQDEKALLADKDNKAYTFTEELSEAEKKLGIPDGNQAVYQMDTQVRLGKDRLGKDSKEIKDITPPKKSKAKPARHKYGEYKNVLLSDDEMEKLKTEFPDDYQERIDRLSEYCASTGKSYKNYLATIRNCAKREFRQQAPQNGYRRNVRREKLPEWAKDSEVVKKPKNDSHEEIDVPF
ncbi:replisome organizer, partial [Vibrio parahaemolyticus]|nr:replisome organizer [Vibrio parahaemolyticus]